MLLYDNKIYYNNPLVTNVRAKIMDKDSFASYMLDTFPFEINDLVTVKTLYPSIIMSVDLYQTILHQNEKKAITYNALIAYWPTDVKRQFAVLEFKAVYHRLAKEPDITPLKRAFIQLLHQQWNVTFKGKQLIVS